MEKIPSMVDMARTPEETKDLGYPTPMQSKYPYGLCLSLCEDELEKLGFEQGELQVSDMVHLHCMATVTSVSSSDNVNSGPSCRVELQVTHISAEDEAEEDKEADKKMSGSQRMSKLYASKS
jgi:hypothetical protein